MSDGQVYVVDHVVTRPGRGREFVDRYLAEYAPGARDRGMTLRDIIVSPPIWFTDQSNTITITWLLPSAKAWWEMTWKGRSDPRIGDWWANMSGVIAERSRKVGAAAADVDELCDV